MDLHLRSALMVARPAIDRTLAALADPTRRQVIEQLRVRPRRAGELSAALDASPPAMSRHLRVLRRSGLVDERGDPTDGRLRVYALRREPFDALTGWLAEIEGYWTDQLASFAALVDREEP
ncbi:MAG: metalloregulator ArsR/SmtB family transcription factor, partial [Myxococcota bacterium]